MAMGASGAAALDSTDRIILHVEDNPAFADLTHDWLSRTLNNATIKTIYDPRDALDILGETAVDCIISDYELPHLTGIEFLERVRESYPDLPFILYTGEGSESVASDAFAADATDYVQKGAGADRFEILTNRVVDAIEKYQAERQRDRQLEAIESAREGISILNEDGEFVYVNQAYADLYGYAPSELIGKHWSLIYPQEEIPRAESEILPTVRETGYWHGETQGLRSDGTTFAEDHVVSTTEAGDLVCTVRDYSEHDAIKQERDQFQTLVETLTDPVYIVDEHGQFEYINDAFVELVGYDRDRIIGSTPDLIKTDASVERAEEHLAQLLSSDGPNEVTFEIDVTTKDGRTIRCQDHMGLLPYDGEQFVGSVGVMRDITNLVQTQEELERQNERLDEFVSVVSHDLRNPLNVAAGHLELARKECDSALDSLACAREAIDRMDELIDGLVEFAREGQQISATEPVCLDAAVEEAWAMTPTADATLECTADESIYADRSRLQQLLSNLIRNAVTHGGENVTVSVGTTDEGFYIADDGSGIPVNEQDRIFEAGFTQTAEGTGLGLAIVREIVVAHGWDIVAGESATDGARFDIREVEFDS